MVDANQAQEPGTPGSENSIFWGYDRALATSKELFGLGVTWLEEPLPRYDFDGIRKLTAATDLPRVTLVIAEGGGRSDVARLAVETATATATVAATARVWSIEQGDVETAGSEVTDPVRVSVGHESVEGADAPPAEGLDHTAPANLVLFLFLNSVASAGLLVDSRRLGVLPRLLATSSAKATIVAGQALGRLAICALQAIIVIAGTRLVLGVRWGAPLVVLAVVVLFSAVAASASVVTAALLRTREQVLFLAPPVAIVLGMLGGCMWPLRLVSPTLRTIGHATPHAWAVDALEASMRGSGGGIGTALAVLAGFALALGAVAVAALRRSVTTA
jgi:ABC-2 type transport system permease protein